MEVNVIIPLGTYLDTPSASWCVEGQRSGTGLQSLLDQRRHALPQDPAQCPGEGGVTRPYILLGIDLIRMQQAHLMHLLTV